MASLYDALDVRPQSSLEEIRRAYHRAARLHHPDKRVAGSAATDDDAGASARDGAAEPLTGGTDSDFLRVQEAYETLRDPARRAQYDAKLARDAIVRKRDEEDVRISDVVSVHDMKKEMLSSAEDDDDYDEDTGGEVIYSHQCRCGDVYEVTEDELLDGVDVVPCNGCSLNIRVTMTAP